MLVISPAKKIIKTATWLIKKAGGGKRIYSSLTLTSFMSRYVCIDKPHGSASMRPAENEINHYTVKYSYTAAV